MQGTNQNHIKAVDREVREEEINARTEKGKRKRKVKCITVLMPRRTYDLDPLSPTVQHGGMKKQFVVPRLMLDSTLLNL